VTFILLFLGKGVPGWGRITEGSRPDVASTTLTSLIGWGGSPCRDVLGFVAGECNKQNIKKYSLGKMTCCPRLHYYPGKANSPAHARILPSPKKADRGWKGMGAYFSLVLSTSRGSGL